MRFFQAVRCGVLALLALCGALCVAQTPLSVVMLSDIHFDPFRDPAKVPQLRTAPMERWPAILNGAPSPTQPADLQLLETNCGSRALDSSWPLLKTTLAAARDAEPRPLFVTLSGDLLTHDFPCRFQRLSPGASAQDLAAFSAKTVAFVLRQLRQTFPRVPVYASLGNNDSGCNDYRETPNDLFLTQTADELRAAALDLTLPITPEGDYSLALPAPMDHTRLIVLDDVFESRQFTTCSGAADRSPERAQIDWLRMELRNARAHHEHVWVMGHVPPGIDVYNSFRRYLLQPAGMCNAAPRPFLADTALPDALLDYADTVRLALFGHTHMDEIRVLHRDSPPAESASAKSPSPDVPSEAEAEPDATTAKGTAVSRGSVRRGAGPSSTADATIPVKLVPSVSPYVGNHPAFLVARADPRTAVLKDWRTFVSPGPQGSTPPWAEAYRYAAAYHLPDFSAASALKLAEAFTADKTGQAEQSTTFRQHFYPGDMGIYALGLAQIWPAYACAVRDDRPSAVQTCVCATVPAPQKAQP